MAGGTQCARPLRQTIRVDFERVTWAVTVAIFSVVAITLFFSGYDGYGGVFLCVAAAAAVNLLPSEQISN